MYFERALILLLQYGTDIAIAFSSCNFRKYLLLSAWERYSSIAYMKQLAPIQRTVTFTGYLGLLYSTILESDHSSISLSMALRAMVAEPEVSSLLNCLFVPWGNSCRVQTPTEQCENGQEPLTALTVTNTTMGQSQTCPTGVASSGARPPSPRIVTPLQVIEPPQRFFYYHPHFPFSFPDRTVSYSPPYSPSLFKRPDRR